VVKRRRELRERDRGDLEVMNVDLGAFQTAL